MLSGDKNLGLAITGDRDQFFKLTALRVQHKMERGGGRTLSLNPFGINGSAMTAGWTRVYIVPRGVMQHRKDLPNLLIGMLMAAECQSNSKYEHSDNPRRSAPGAFFRQLKGWFRDKTV